MSITGRTRLAGVFGWPIAHSRSPLLHNHWLAEHAIDGAYVPLAVEPQSFEDAFRCLGKFGFVGANVTVPYKEAALAYVDEADELAARVGAVNTVTVGPGGELRGSNTDGFGFMSNLTSGAPNWQPERGPVVVIGAGGAARAIVVTLLDAGVPELRIINRSSERADALANDITDQRLSTAAWPDRRQALGDAALLVNTTAAGLTGHESLDLNIDQLPRDAVVTDLVYDPLITPLLQQARGRGNPVVDGLGMLIHQARPGFAAWFGVEPRPTPAVRDLLERDLANNDVES